MRVKTPITLSPSTLAALDTITEPTANRSKMIERAILEFLDRRRQRTRNARDLEILDRSAAELDREMDDFLALQVDL